jgi:uncharacterized protein (TIGR02246 family)
MLGVNFRQDGLPRNADRLAGRYCGRHFALRLSFGQEKSHWKETMRRRMKLALAILVSGCLLSGHYSSLNAQVNPVEASSEDTKAIEAIVHSNPSDHVTEDVSFTNIFGTVRYGRAEFVKRHIEIANTIFKGTTPKSSIAKLRFVRQDVAIADVSGEITGFPKTPPAGVPVGADGVLRFKLLLVLIKEQDVWWITEYHNVAVTPEV